MAKCTKCNYKWSNKEIIQLGFSKDGKECSNCNMKQYISSETQAMSSLGYISLVFITLFPFVVKLSDKKDGYL